MSRSMSKVRLAVSSMLLLTLCAGCFFNVGSRETRMPIDDEIKQAIDEIADLVVAGEHDLYSVNSKSSLFKRIFHTEQPIGHISYTQNRLLVTVLDSQDGTGFKGFYLRDKSSDSFIQIPTPRLSPNFSYVYGDFVFLTDAAKTPHKGADYTKVGIYRLSDHKWVKEWLVPGGIEDVEGRGKDVYFVASNNQDTSSNIYKTDITTGEQSQLIPNARRYPLDEVAVDSNGDIYMMISQRRKTEWSNKIYRFNPEAAPYELYNNFVSNTKPYSYSMNALMGKAFIIRHNAAGEHDDFEKPLAVLDLKTKKQVFLEWEHRPVSIDHTADEFVVLADDGTIAFIKPELNEQTPREIRVEGLESGKVICVKKDEP